MAPGSTFLFPEFSEKLADQLGAALHSALEILQVPTRDELDAVKARLDDVGDIIDELNDRCDALLTAKPVKNGKNL